MIPKKPILYKVPMLRSFIMRVCPGMSIGVDLPSTTLSVFLQKSISSLRHVRSRVSTRISVLLRPIRGYVHARLRRHVVLLLLLVMLLLMVLLMVLGCCSLVPVGDWCCSSRREQHARIIRGHMNSRKTAVATSITYAHVLRAV